jgi:hypothetical protein
MLYAILKPKQKIKAKDVFDKEQLKGIKLQKGEKIYKLEIKICQKEYTKEVKTK